MREGGRHAPLRIIAPRVSRALHRGNTVQSLAYVHRALGRTSAARPAKTASQNRPPWIGPGTQSLWVRMLNARSTTASSWSWCAPFQ